MVAIVDLSTLNLPDHETTNPELEQTEALEVPEARSLSEEFALEEQEAGEKTQEHQSPTEAIDLAQLTRAVPEPPPVLLSQGATEEPSDINESIPQAAEVLAEEISAPEAEAETEPEAAALTDEDSSLPENENLIEETVQAQEPPPPEAPAITEEVIQTEKAAAPVEAAVLNTATEPASDPISPSESAPQTAVKEVPEKTIVASVKKPVRKKPPEKEKIKKIGLLSLLKTRTKDSAKKPSLLAKRFSEERRLRRKKTRPTSDLRSSGKEQGVGRLKRDVLDAEQQRLMKRPSLSAGSPSEIEISQGGGRSYNIVSSSIQKKSTRLAMVYSGILQGNPNLQGNVLVEFEISSEGRVTKCSILTSSLGNPKFEKKLVQEILHWTFRPTKKGKTTVLYPLSFFPSS